MSADGRKVDAEVIVNATGARPDHTAATELRLDLDPILGSTRALAPLIDPNQHSCGTVPPHGVDELTQPEPGFYVVGAKSYGRAPTFLLATGYEQTRSVVAALAGDWAAARDVQLDLPETGVCSSRPARRLAREASCCGPAPSRRRTRTGHRRRRRAAHPAAGVRHHRQRRLLLTDGATPLRPRPPPLPVAAGRWPGRSSSGWRSPRPSGTACCSTPSPSC